jgi:hypothetical protein
MTRIRLVAVSLSFLTGAVTLGAAAAGALAAEYLPLPLGATWQYISEAGGAETQIVTGTRNLFGTDTWVISYQDSPLNDGLENYWTTNAEGDVFLWGFFRNLQGWGWAYQPPIRMVDAPLSLGQEWSTTYTIYELPGFVPEGTNEYPLEVSSEGMVTVPAGTYFAYGIGIPELPLLGGYSITGEVVAGAPGHRAASDWWSDGVGRVQYEVDQIYRLTSFGWPTPVAVTSWGRVKALYRE